MSETQDSAQGKAVRITCEGASSISVDDLTELQGQDFKTLTEESYLRMRRTIEEDGFQFPVFVWRSDGKNFIVDAHQRRRVLLKMRDEEGWTVPPLPCCWIHAKDKKSAAEALLRLNSHYGKMDVEGLYKFVHENEIDWNSVVGKLDDFDFVRLTAFDEGWMRDSSQQVNDPQQEWKGMPTFSQQDLKGWKTLLVHFKGKEEYEAFAKLVSQPMTESTKSIWYPFEPKADAKNTTT